MATLLSYGGCQARERPWPKIQVWPYLTYCGPRNSWLLLLIHAQLFLHSLPLSLPHEEVPMKLQRPTLLVFLGLALAAGATLWGCGQQDRLGSPVGVDFARQSTPLAAGS